MVCSIGRNKHVVCLCIYVEIHKISDDFSIFESLWRDMLSLQKNMQPRLLYSLELHDLITWRQYQLNLNSCFRWSWLPSTCSHQLFPEWTQLWQHLRLIFGSDVFWVFLAWRGIVVSAALWVRQHYFQPLPCAKVSSAVKNITRLLPLV